MLGMTLVFNLPINVAVLRSDEERGDPERWRQVRRRWDRIHTGRVLLASAGFALVAAAASSHRAWRGALQARSVTTAG